MFGQKYHSSESSSSGGGESGQHWIKRFPKNEDRMTVRLLSDDLDDTSYMVRYTEVYDRNVKRGWPLHTDEPTTEYEEETSQDVNKRVLLTVLNVKEDRVWAWAPPWTVIEYIEGLLKAKGTATDVDLLVIREGTGLDTKYHVYEGDRYTIDPSKYDLPDLEQVLGHARQRAEDEGWAPSFSTSQTAEKPATAPAPEPQAETPSEPAEAQEAAPTAPHEATLDDLPDGWQKHSIAKVRVYARKFGVEPKGMTRDEIVAAIETSAEPF